MPADATATPAYDFRSLRELRRRAGLTIAAVAGRAGLSAAVISKLERNQATPELDTLFRLARVFGQTAADLLQLAEARTAQIQHATAHAAGEFHFREVRFANLRALLGEAARGARLSRPEVHRDDHEVIWALAGRLRVTLPRETHLLAAGDAIQFDAIWEHTYEALDDCRFLLLHLAKHKRF
ncbi:MAG: XRE family transcriptional regulator [Lentisphaeria bacterium]|jgi:transcriptional regulator with XRE-family HTH domain